jgi:hypothetical protein
MMHFLPPAYFSCPIVPSLKKKEQTQVDIQTQHTHTHMCVSTHARLIYNTQMTSILVAFDAYIYIYIAEDG